MELKAAVERYLEVVNEFLRPMPLSGFGLPKHELEAMLGAWDEDYHLHRHFELLPPSAPPSAVPETAAVYWVHGHAYGAIVFHESIRDVLGHDTE
jgi:hypothetical protein